MLHGSTNQAVCRYASAVSYVSHEKDEQGRVSEVHVHLESKVGKPPKGVLNWIGQTAPGKAPPTAEARLYADAVWLHHSCSAPNSRTHSLVPCMTVHGNLACVGQLFLHGVLLWKLFSMFCSVWAVD